MAAKDSIENLSKPITLRCYLWPTKEGCYAECIDLDIVVQRPTAHEAREALNDAVFGYLRAALEQGWFEQLVPRKSPLRRRLAYHLRFIRAAACSWLHGVESFFSMRATIKDGQLQYA